MKAVCKKAGIIPQFANLLENFFSSCDFGYICNAALASKEQYDL